MAQFVGKSNTFHSDANCGGYPHSFAQEMQNVASEVSKMIRRTSLYIASRFCDWRPRAALSSYFRWMGRSEKLFSNKRGQQ